MLFFSCGEVTQYPKNLSLMRGNIWHSPLRIRRRYQRIVDGLDVGILGWLMFR
jgi:hypothetical protein